MFSTNQVPARIEWITDGGMDGGESLGLPRRFESPGYRTTLPSLPEVLTR